MTLKSLLLSLFSLVSLGGAWIPAQALPGSLSSSSEGFDWTELDRQLGGEGLVGEVHAVRTEHDAYVFTYRKPGDFFSFVHISLVPASEQIAEMLSGLSRHDRIRIRGERLPLRTPQPHVEVTSVEIVQKHESSYPTPEYEYEARIPDELVGKDSTLFLVHAVHAGGRILVVEYKDAVLPVFVNRGDLTAHLYRSDIVRLKYRIQSEPNRPTHLRLQESAPNAVEVLESALAKHGRTADITGHLVLFPRSPQVSFDVWAVQELSAAGARRQYTLINFASIEVFEALRAKCAAAWARDPQNYVNGRNKLVHRSLKVRARGQFNVVDANQANVQIILNSADDLEIVAE